MASDAMDTAVTKLTAAIEAGIKAVGTLGEKYGPEVIDSALWVVRINGINNILSNVLGVVLAAGTVWVCWHYGLKEWRAHDDKENTNPAIIMSTSFGILFGSIIFIICASSVLNIWHWVAIFEPRLWIARKLLGL